MQRLLETFKNLWGAYFHVVAWAGEAVDAVRRRITNELRKEIANLKEDLSEVKKANDTTAIDLKHEAKKLEQLIQSKKTIVKAVKNALYPLGKKPESLSPYQQDQVEQIAATKPTLYRAYQRKEELRLILKLKEPVVAKQALDSWYFRARHSRIPEINDLATKIKRHMPNILNTIENQFSSARLESMNAKIKLMIIRAYGFRNVDNLIAYVMLFCSAIKIPLPNRPGSISISELI